jgi:hypothetical protein
MLPTSNSQKTAVAARGWDMNLMISVSGSGFIVDFSFYWERPESRVAEQNGRPAAELKFPIGYRFDAAAGPVSDPVQ